METEFMTYLKPVLTLDHFRPVKEPALNSLVVEDKLNWAVHRCYKAHLFSVDQRRTQRSDLCTCCFVRAA